MPSAAALLPALLVVAAVLGLAVGSFLNVVIHRLPLGLSLSRPGSRCPSCGTPIRARDNVPVLGWLLLHGRCHTCRAPIGARYPLVEAGTAVAFVAVVAALVAGGDDREFASLAPVPAWLWLAACLVAAALIDVDGNRVPTRFAVLAPAVVVVLLAVTAAPVGDGAALVRAAVGGIVLGGVAVVALVGRDDRAGVAGFAAAAGLALGALSWLALVVGGALAVAAIVTGAASSRRLPVVALLAAATAVGLGAAAAAGY